MLCHSDAGGISFTPTSANGKQPSFSLEPIKKIKRILKKLSDYSRENEKLKN